MIIISFLIIIYSICLEVFASPKTMYWTRIWNLPYSNLGSWCPCVNSWKRGCSGKWVVDQNSWRIFHKVKEFFTSTQQLKWRRIYFWNSEDHLEYVLMLPCLIIIVNGIQKTHYLVRMMNSPDSSGIRESIIIAILEHISAWSLGEGGGNAKLK